MEYYDIRYLIFAVLLAFGFYSLLQSPGTQSVIQISEFSGFGMVFFTCHKVRQTVEGIKHNMYMCNALSLMKLSDILTMSSITYTKQSLYLELKCELFEQITSTVFIILFKGLCTCVEVWLINLQ